LIVDLNCRIFFFLKIYLIKGLGDIILFYFVQNIMLFSLIFWLLTWIAEYFFKKKIHLTKKQLYECGFRTLSELNIQSNLNFSMICVFLILYDIEFVFLFPLFFNFYYLNFLSLIIFIIFFIFIIYSLYYDYQFNTLNWQF